MTVQEMFDKYCKKDSYGYNCHGANVTLKPASEQEIVEFKSLCRKYGVEPKIEEELEAYYRQNNNFFDYYTCNDSEIFSWWEGEEQRQIWLGCLDDDSFVYDETSGKYWIGEAGDDSIGTYDTLMEMFEAYLKEGWENGWNG